MSETWKRVSGWSEEGDGDSDEPNFGRKARQWFARSVRAKIQKSMIDAYGPCENDYEYDIDALVEWFTENATAMRFVEWQNEATYKGKNWNSGAWVIDWSKVSAAMRRAERETDSDTFATLDDFLRYDIKHCVHWSEIEETGDDAQLTSKQRRQLYLAAAARRNHWPRLCIDCHAEFRRAPKAKGRTPLRCPSCIARKKELKENPPTRPRKPRKAKSA